MTGDTGKNERPHWEPRFRRRRPGTVSAGLLLRGYAVVFAERFLSAFWPFLTLLAAGIAVAASGWPGLLPAWPHVALLAVAAGMFGWTLVRSIRAFRRPRRNDVLRHLERSNKLQHRPLEALEDRIAFGEGDSAAQSLWALHRRQAIDASQNMGAGHADPHLSRRDPLALRLAALLALLAVASLAGDRAILNILHALQPHFSPRTDLAKVTLDAWITPPEYTSVAPIFLSRTDSAEGGDSLRAQAPVGSRLVIQVGGAEEPPQLELTDSAEAFDPNGSRSYRIEKELTADADLAVTIDDDPVAEWRVAVTPDNPPEAALSDRPFELTERRSLELDYKATDDYGVVALSIEIRKTKERIDGQETISIDIASPDTGEREVTGTTFVNLLEHIWAGDPVFAELKVEDALGQTIYSDPLPFALPARDFQHPIARALIDQRRILATGRQEVAPDVGYDLQAIGQSTELYAGDVVVFMGLSLAHRRLMDRRAGNPTDETIDNMVDLLWDLALRLEDGDLSVAERRLREAERALADAIARGADEEEIERLMDELQQAMDDYMRAMAQEALRQMQDGETTQNPLDEDAQTLAKSDVDQIMERIRELLRQGQKDAAQRLLQQLQKMMENLQAGISSRPSPEAMEAMEMLEGMQQLMKGQQELLDRTFRNSQDREFMEGQGTDNQNSGNNLQQGETQRGSGPRGADAALQEALRQQLGDIRKRFEQMMGSAPQSFGQADREMRRSSDALQQNAPGDAVGPQGRALDQMREAARAAQEAFMQRYGSQMGQGQQAQGQGQQQNQSDPFNRRQGRTGIGTESDASDVNIPSNGELKRAREIRDELRRRSSDRNRPESELQYLERLLNPFD
ncbi:MAG: TIGR02302 family protein [Alphaproteobacteria bacterium]